MHIRFDLLALSIIALAVAVSDGRASGNGSESGRAMREECPLQPTAFCFRDSASYRKDPGDPYGMPQQDWILFGNAGDSVDLLAGPEAFVQTNLGVDQLADHNNAPYFRRRLRAAGVVAASVLLDINSDTNPYPYWLRVAQRSKRPNAALELTGARATVIAGTSHNLRDSFSIVPLSIVSG